MPSRPPAVPVGELLDTLEAALSQQRRRPLRCQLLTRHPLQPFDPANFAPGALGRPGAVQLRPDRAGRSPGDGGAAPPRRRRSLPRRCRRRRSGDLEIDALRTFFEHPVRGFLRQRLGVTLPRREEETSDRLPVQLDSLERWQIGQRMLDARLSGVEPDHCRQAEWRRGALPPGRLGARVLDDVASEVEQIVAEAARLA